MLISGLKRISKLSFSPNGKSLSSFTIIADCESLIRRILVLDPNKRYNIEQIKNHPWMQMEVSI